MSRQPSAGVLSRTAICHACQIPAVTLWNWCPPPTRTGNWALPTSGLTGDGLAYCWGSNRDGKAGPSSATRVMLAQLVSADLAFRQLSAGVYHTCGITQDGEDAPSAPASATERRFGVHTRTFQHVGRYRYRCTLHSTDFEQGHVGEIGVLP